MSGVPARDPAVIVDETADADDGRDVEEMDWALLDPPDGHPDAAEVAHEEVVAHVCAQLGLAPGTLG